MADEQPQRGTPPLQPEAQPSQSAPEPEPKTDPKPSGGKKVSNSAAGEREYDRAVKAAEDREKEAARVGEETAAAREARREEFDGSEQGDVHAQIERSEEIMRMPTDRALKAMGSKVGDPTKGPAS